MEDPSPTNNSSECCVECSEVICPSVVSKCEALSLSERTISRRVQEIGANIKEQLRNEYQSFKQFSVALDESTDNRSIAQLAIFVRGVENDFKNTEELLDVIALKNTTTGEDIFLAAIEVMNEVNLSIERLCSIATDGASEMMSDGAGFVGRMKENVRDAGLPPIVTVRCLLHQDQVCAKVFHKFKSMMDTVMKLIISVESKG